MVMMMKRVLYFFDDNSLRIDGRKKWRISIVIIDNSKYQHFTKAIGSAENSYTSRDLVI